MRVLVTGAGRGGTSLAREVVRGLNIVKFPEDVEEDRQFFKYEKLPHQYGTKLTVENEGFTLKNLVEMMERYCDLYIIYALRHPVDNCMSKIVRGQRSSDGGDSRVEELAPDATVEGAIAAVEHSRSIHRGIVKRFSNRVYTVMMEDLILNSRMEVFRIAAFLEVRITGEAFEFYKYNTNVYQKERYGNQLDELQIGLYKKWATVYGGFFKNRGEDIKRIIRSFE